MDEKAKRGQQSGNRKTAERAARLWDGRRTHIEQLYAGHATLRDIASVYGCSAATIGKRLKMWGHDITARRANYGERNGRYKDGRQSRLYRGLVSHDKCQRCGSVERLGVHHINNDHYDNRVENLEVLCVSCHMSHHKTQYWEEWRRGQPDQAKSNGPVGWVGARTRE